MENASTGFGHDYHNLANEFRGFHQQDDRPGGIDVNYKGGGAKDERRKRLRQRSKNNVGHSPFNPFNITPSYFTYDQTEGSKMTE